MFSPWSSRTFAIRATIPGLSRPMAVSQIWFTA
jgi:hypothetical protein